MHRLRLGSQAEEVLDVGFPRRAFDRFRSSDNQMEQSDVKSIVLVNIRPVAISLTVEDPLPCSMM